MKPFVKLFEKLDQTTKTNARIDALVTYIEEADEQDLLWAIALLSGKRPKRAIKTSSIKELVLELADIPEWLYDESYQVVGDMAETIALLLPDQASTSDNTLSQWMQAIIESGSFEEADKKHFVKASWMSLNRKERFVFNKLIGGSFRIGVSQKTMVKALAIHTGMQENELAHRLMGNWSPTTTTYHQLIHEENNADNSKPYPFYLAYPVEDIEALDVNPEAWQAERKWDGIRGQIIKRNDQIFIWSRGEELVTDKFPEFESLKNKLPNGTVIDGELLPFKDGKPLTFHELQRRIGRKTVGKKLLSEVPVVLFSYDLLELDHEDLREKPLAERRHELERMVAKVDDPVLHISATLKYQTYEDLFKMREDSRSHFAEGLMLKRKDSTYKVGRKRGDWWKWKVDPLVIDAVLIYAMKGHGRRANLYTDYTFAVWKGKELVPFTKAYSGLTDEEFRKVDRFVKANVIEKFGPVRSVKPELVFEIAFEGIAKSTRHKSGISLRFPRMSRWRTDKKTEEANTLADLEEMLSIYGN